MLSLPRKGGLLTFSAAGTTSTAVELPEGRLVALVTDSAMDAVTLTFEASIDGGTTWVLVKDSAGANISITATANRMFGLSDAQASMLSGVRRLRLVSSVAQGDQTVVTLIVR